MNTVLAPFFLFSFLLSTVLAAPHIDTPLNVAQCQPALLTWSDGTGPYHLTVHPDGQPSAAPLVDLEKQTGNSYTWIANLKAGTACFLQLRDSTGAIGQSGTINIISSSDSSCLNATSTAASASPSSNATTGASSVSTGTPSHSISSASASGTTGGTTKTTSTGASQPKSSSGATVSHYTPVGTLAMIGAAAVALVL